MAGGATGGAIEGGHALCGSTESRTENGAEGGETKRLDLGGDVAARRRESCHARAVQPGTPPGNTIPVTIDPFKVEDGVPSEAEVEWAVKRLRNTVPGDRQGCGRRI